MMKLSEINPYTFRNLRKVLGHREPSRRSMVDECRADDSEMCREVVAKGMLTEEQMAHAAERYRLGKSRSGKTIYWLINQQGIVMDGRIGTSWVSQLLKAREPELAKYVSTDLCLFGLHLLMADGRGMMDDVYKVAIVDCARSAVILSELFPVYLWMAPCSCFTLDLLEPLKGSKVMLFPRTDATMEHYMVWLELADQARRAYRLDISVSAVLEDHATAEQKARCIDLVDYLFHTQNLYVL